MQMPNRYMKRCSTSLITDANQNCHVWNLTAQIVTLAIINKSKDSKYWWVCGERKPLCPVGGNVNWCSHCRKQHGGSSNKLKIQWSYPRVPLLGIYPRKWTQDSKVVCALPLHCSIIQIHTQCTWEAGCIDYLHGKNPSTMYGAIGSP